MWFHEELDICPENLSVPRKLKITFSIDVQIGVRSKLDGLLLDSLVDLLAAFFLVLTDSSMQRINFIFASDGRDSSKVSRGENVGMICLAPDKTKLLAGMSSCNLTEALKSSAKFLSLSGSSRNVSYSVWYVSGAPNHILRATFATPRDCCACDSRKELAFMAGTPPHRGPIELHLGRIPP